MYHQRIAHFWSGYERNSGSGSSGMIGYSMVKDPHSLR